MRTIRNELERRSPTAAPALSASVLCGGLWGIAEATLGYLLHLITRVVPAPGLAGFVMFPVGVYFMLKARNLTGRSSAPFLTAVAAAAVKLASAALPGVGWLFVVNPAIAILAQGAAVTAGAVLLCAPDRYETRRETGYRRWAVLSAGAFAVSAGWRLTFLALVAALPVQKGILMKGTPAIAAFLGIESAVNALLITAGAIAAVAMPFAWRTGFIRRWAASPAAAAVVIAVSAAVQTVLSAA